MIPHKRQFSDSCLSEPGFSGLQDGQDWELVGIYSVAKDEGQPFATEHWHTNLLSCQSYNPVHPGSDIIHVGGCFAHFDLWDCM